MATTRADHLDNEAMEHDRRKAALKQRLEDILEAAGWSLLYCFPEPDSDEAKRFVYAVHKRVSQRFNMDVYQDIKNYRRPVDVLADYITGEE